jgi:prophage antirepressor-like protein
MSNNAPAVFQFENSQIRTITKDGEPWFVAVDVCAVLGIINTTDAIKRLDDDERTLDLIEGSHRQTNIVNESGLYSLILRSDKPEAKRFKKWITSEVLPALRKTGSYSLDPMAALSDPATMRTLLLQYAEKNIEMQPKALAFDMLMSTKNSMTMGEAAKALGWGRNMLFSILRNDHILMSNNVPYQEYINRDYFRVRTVTIEIGDHTEMKTQTLVTSKGLNWLAQNNVEHMQARKALLVRKASATA